MGVRILLFGKNGQLGWELQRALAPLGEILAHTSATCDFADIDLVRRTIVDTAPDIIINAAAYTAVDRAEQDQVNAFKINAEVVGVIAECASIQHALLVHYSSDYVFDGRKSGPYCETDATNPLSIYGVSKYRGEEAIIDSGCDYLIFRTSWVFAARGANFIKTILRSAAQKDVLRVVADQWGAPTGAELIADISAHVVRAVMRERANCGVYHLTANGEINWHGYASYIIDRARRLGASLQAEMIEPIATAEYSLPAMRPANSRLDTTKLQNAFNLWLPHWQYHVDRVLTELIENPA
jgi:dTDP-4-dehydrorhamnose reductase